MLCEIKSGGPYKHALLTQKCTQCDWNETSHGEELETCPDCGEPVSEKRKLKSGVLRVECTHKENRFKIREDESMVTLYDPDIPDILKFILKHYTDWTGDIHTPHPQVNSLASYSLRYPKRLNPEEFDEELIDYLDGMNQHYASEIARISLAMQT